MKNQLTLNNVENFFLADESILDEIKKKEKNYPNDI